MRVRFTDLDGKVHEEDAEGLFATCIQHEIDHLNGVLFVDYLSKLKRDRVLKKFTKAAKRATEEMKGRFSEFRHGRASRPSTPRCSKTKRGCPRQARA